MSLGYWQISVIIVEELNKNYEKDISKYIDFSLLFSIG
jgi:hypothetical protein